jgi:hypothetical protein
MQWSSACKAWLPLHQPLHIQRSGNASPSDPRVVGQGTRAVANDIYQREFKEKIIIMKSMKV